MGLGIWEFALVEVGKRGLEDVYIGFEEYRVVPSRRCLGMMMKARIWFCWFLSGTEGR